MKQKKTVELAQVSTKYRYVCDTVLVQSIIAWQITRAVRVKTIPTYQHSYAVLWLPGPAIPQTPEKKKNYKQNLQQNSEYDFITQQNVHPQ